MIRMMVRISFGKGPIPLLLSLLIILDLSSCAEDNNIFDNGRNRQLEFSVKTFGWNNSNSSTNSKLNSRATLISGTTFDTSNSFNVIADVNHGGNWSTEVNNETASYSTANNIWQTSATHYWPGAASTVNFYAYYPTSISSNITHTPGSAPVLSYIVPDNATDQIDILASSKTGVAGDSYNKTPIDFKHILAAVQVKSGSTGLPNGTGAVLKIKNIQYKGAYTFGSGWTIFPDVKDLSQTVNLSTFGTSADITNEGGIIMMLPQTFSDVTIEITYTNGLVLSKTINGTWEAGKIYIYNLTKSITYNYDYTGNVQTFTVPYTGTYKIECWGAEGGDDPCKGSAIPGKGAYTSGYVNLTSGKQLFLYIGGVGSSLYKQINYGGWNGGGTSTSNQNKYFPSGGGGSTDVRLIKHSGSDGWSGTSSLRSRIMVAAGGGGCLADDNTIANGANAGSFKGYVPYDDVNSQYSESRYDGTGATQISCGSCPAYDDSNWFGYINIRDGTMNPWGNFGYANQSYVDLYWAGGGGSGWWGGLSVFGRGGGGGSSFISGMPGCVAMSADGTQNTSINYMTVNGTIYSFISPVMKDGASSMPAPLGGTETGHSGNGYARITFVSAN